MAEPFHFQILEEISRTYTAVLYRALDKRTDLQVALKFPVNVPGLALKELERFTTEALAQASIHHANVQQLYQVGLHNGRPYLVLELPEGLTLEQRLKRQPMAFTEILELMDILAETVYFCHCLGVIHGNLTPSNIVLTADRGPKITGFDFSCGYSELECKKGLVPAPTSSSFIPPEQGVTSVRDIGPAKDICALGAIAYYLITWQSWSPQCSVWQVIEQARSGLLTRPLGLRPDLDPEVESVCMKCFENRPGKRYHSAEELSVALRAVLSKQTGLRGHS